MSMKRMVMVAVEVVATCIIPCAGFCATWFVAPSGDDLNSGTSENTAFRTIQHAVNSARFNDNIMVLAGVYEPFVSSNKRVRVRSADGIGSVIVDGRNEYRCATLGNSTSQTNTVLEGIVLANGNSGTDSIPMRNGGGVSGGTLIGCTIVDCMAIGMGGGCFGSVLRNCRVVGCSVTNSVDSTTESGGGVANSTLHDCEVVGNYSAGHGGGIFNGMAYNCLVASNTAAMWGGGMRGGRAYGTRFYGNFANIGGGVAGNASYSSNGDFEGCDIVGNFAMYHGGGAAGGTLRGCIVCDNDAQSGGGGMSALQSALLLADCCVVSNNVSYSRGGGLCELVPSNMYACARNCLFAYNTASSMGGGVYGGALTNVTVVANVAKTASGTYQSLAVNSIIDGESFSLKGANNVCEHIGFRNKEAGDFSLLPTSPCIDEGLVVDVGYVDLLGNPRVVGNEIDIGAIEAGWVTIETNDCTFAYEHTESGLRVYCVGAASGVIRIPETIDDFQVTCFGGYGAGISPGVVYFPATIGVIDSGAFDSRNAPCDLHFEGEPLDDLSWMGAFSGGRKVQFLWQEKFDAAWRQKIEEMVLKGWAEVVSSSVNGCELEYYGTVPGVANVSCRQRYPWNDLVDIACKVTGIKGETNGLEFVVAAVMPDSGKVRKVSHFRVENGGMDSVDRKVHTNGNYRLLWNARADLGIVRYTNMVVRVTLSAHDKVQLWQGGPYWATTNIGAENPEDDGYYFWWGDTVGYKREGNAWVATDGSSSNFSFTSSNTPTYNKNPATLESEGWVVSQDGTYVLAPEHDAAQVKWGGDWRMPTAQELNDLCNNKCDWMWTTMNGVNGYIVCGRGGYAANSIFIPSAGYGHGTSFPILNDGSYGSYWSSVPYSYSDVSGCALYFNSSSRWANYDNRFRGFPVRPVQGFAEAQATLADDSAPFLLDTAEGTRIAQEGEAIPVAYSPHWNGATSCTVAETGKSVLVADATDEGAVAWAPQGVGCHTLTHTAGDKTLTARFAVLGDDVVVHSGKITASEVWESNKVHLVTAPITLGDNNFDYFCGLEIQPGAIVKFMPGTGISIESNAYCNASGAIFTHVNDDTVGGDTLMDGDEAAPVMDDYLLPNMLLWDETIELRYYSDPNVTLSGTISENETWRGHNVYCVTGNLTVASGKTLTIMPGAIVKFAAGLSLTVNGALNAQGTRAQPIVFTSNKDDEHGGDTNGDGEKTYPYAGDWHQIKVTGTASFNYCHVLYNSSAENYGGVEAYGGTVAFDNSEIAHTRYECVNAHSSGNFIARNSIFRDSSLGFGYYGSGRVKAYNCVFSDLSVAVRQRGKTLANCIFYRCLAFTDQSGDGSTYKNCCFYNPSGYGVQSCSMVGSSGNIWGDPLFVDSNNGDFRIAANSLCIDAGDGAVAPETDWWGQPRMDVKRVKDTGTPNGDDVCPDIGIYEVPGTAGVPLPDLAVVGSVMLKAPGGSPSSATANPGDSITVTYIVTNRGAAAAAGLVRDLFRFKGADALLGGQTVDAAEIQQTYSIGAGASATQTATITVPTLRAGSWKIAVEVNPSRDVYEQNLSNNSATSEDVIDVELEAMGNGTQSVTVDKGRTVGFILSELPVSGGVMRVTGAGVGYINAYGGNGAVPAGDVGALGPTRPASVVLADGSLLVVFPARSEGENAYLVLENGGNAAATVSVEVKEPELELYSATPARIANVGEATITITGSGLSDITAVTLGGRTAKSVEALNAAQIAATFDVEGMAEGAYGVTVEDRSRASATLPNAVEIYAAKTGAKLRAWLEMPSSVRDGRVFTGYVCYANEGDSPMTMPVFKVAREDSNTKLGLVASENMTETVLFMGGISPTHPAGVLKAGDAARIPFYFQPFGTYKIKLTHIKDVEDLAAYPTFGGTKAYLVSMSAAATRLNLRGRTAYNVRDFVDQALWEKNGVACAAASGCLVDAKTGVPLANADISLVGTGDSTNLPPATATTDETGYFQLTNLADGEYRWLLDNGNTLADISTNTVVVSTQSDLNNLTVSAAQGGKISGFVMADNGQVLEYAIVSRLDEDGALLDETRTDGYGAFTFTGLIDGTYSLRAMPVDGYSAQTLEGIAIDGATRSQEVVFSLVKGGRISGFVTHGGEVVTNGIVQAITEAGESVQALCATNGFYDLAGLAPGSYAVRYYSNTLESDDVWVDVAPGDGMVLGIETSQRPLFEPTSSQGFDSLTTSFVFSDPVRADGVTAWAWDFDSDGIVDSTEREPTWTYNSIGTNTVTLTISEEGGTTTSIYRNCVAVERKLATILAAGAIVFGENEGSLVTLAMEKSSLTLTGNPAAGVIEVGNVILGKMGDEWYCRRVASVQNLGGAWHLATENATWDEAYEQCTIVTTAEGFLADETEMRGSRRLAAKAGGGSKKKFEIYREVGIDASVTVKPVVKFEHVYNKTSGKTVERFAFVGSLGIEGEVGISGTVGIKANKEIPVGFNIVIPTPVAGVTLENKWKAYIKGDAHVKGSATMGGEVKAAIHLGAEWEKGKKAKWLKPFDASADGHLHGDVEGSASLKVGIKPEFKAKLCGTASAVLAVDAFVKTDLAASAKAPATAGVTAGLDLIGELNLIDWDWKIVDFKVGVSGKVKGPRLDILRWTSPSPDFEYSPSDNLEAPATVRFTDKSKGATWQMFGTSYIRPITAWEWDLGNEQRSNLQNPSTTYSKKGTYTVSLKAKGSGINGPYRKKKKVKVGEKDDDSGDEESDDSKQDTGKKSWDPNEMVGEKGVGEQRLVKPGQELTYTIYFENKEGFDIADAQDVRVTNPLSEWLDWSTFTMGEVAFNNQNDISLDGFAKGSRDIKMDGTDKYVRVSLGGGEDGEGNIATTGVAHWRMRVYDPNGLLGWPNDGSGFLPSNDATHRGEGHLTYRIKVRDDAPANVVITNSATIVFDYNDPIETDPAWWNTVGSLGAQFAASDVEVDEGGNAEIRVSGGDAENASSVKVYLTYNTAAAADVDLKTGSVGGETPKGGLKFPLTLSWEAGEIGEKVITIPVKADKAVEDDELFTLQLADAHGMELGEGRVCTVTIRDPGYDDLAAKVAAGTATKAELKAWDKLQKAKAPYIRGVADSAERGKVSGGGLCAAGKKVTLKASANKGWVFVGWTTEQIPLGGDRLAVGAQDYVATTASLVIDRTAKPAKDSATSTTLTGIDGDATFYANFISADEDKSAIAASVDGWELEPWVSKTETHAFATNVWAGVYLEWPVAASALSATTVKVAGLPSGLKFAAKPVTGKIGSGKAAVVVTNVPANTIYGAPTAASKADKNGAVKPSEVKVTVTTAGKSSQTYQIDTTVAALPSWAQGNFDGGVATVKEGRREKEEGRSAEGESWENIVGTVSLTVSAAGKVSGKAQGDGIAYTLAAPSYSAFAVVPGDDGPVSNFLADVTASWSYKEGSKTVKTNDVVRMTVRDNGIGGRASADGWFEAYTVNWKAEPWKTLGKEFDKKEMSYAILSDGTFSENKEDLASALGADVVGRVTLKLKANGTASVSGEFVSSYDKTKEKYVTVKATASATLVPVSKDNISVFVYLTPKGLAPHARCLSVQ